MTPDEIRKREIDTLLESHRLAWIELSNERNREKRQEIWKQIVFYSDELKKLVLGTEGDA